MIPKKIILFFTIIMSSAIYTQYTMPVSEDLSIAAKLIELMNQAIQFDANITISNTSNKNQHETLWQHATATIAHLQKQYSPTLQKQDITSIKTIALQENKIRELFTLLLNEYLSTFGQMYQKTSTIFYGYSKYLVLTSQSDKSQAITPALYPQLLETIKLAEKQSDWAMNVTIDLPVMLESNIAIMQPCTLATIIKALEQMPPTSAYYNTGKNIALGAAAVGTAYAMYKYGDQLKAFIPATSNISPSTAPSAPKISIENNENSKQLSAMDVLAAGNKKSNNPVVTSMLAHKKENYLFDHQQTNQSTINDQLDIHPTAQNYIAKQAELKNNPSEKTGIFESQSITQPQTKSLQDLQQAIFNSDQQTNSSKTKYYAEDLDDANTRTAFYSKIMQDVTNQQKKPLPYYDLLPMPTDINDDF